MILACQRCRTRFSVQDALATPGTAVQCSHCGQDWSLTATVAFPCRHCSQTPPFQRSGRGVDDWACTRCGGPRTAGPPPPPPRPAASRDVADRVRSFGAPQPPEPLIGPCTTCGELRLERGPAPLGLVSHGCGRCAHTVLDTSHVEAQRAQTRPKGYQPGRRCPICETHALVEAPQTAERPRGYRSTACDASFLFGNQPVPHAPPPRPRPSRWAFCDDCRSTVWRLGQPPRSVPRSPCDRCGRQKLDEGALGLRREWARKMAGSQRVDFSLGPPPFDDCIVCGHRRVIEGRCTACGEVYDGKPLVPSSAERSEATLLENVTSRPDDDEPRRVLAALLRERGDERGEFITLQLDAEAGPLTKQAQRRLDTLDTEMRRRDAPPGVEHTGITFRRGFPHAVVWPGWTDPQHPGWRTVAELLVPAMAPDSGRRGFSPLGGPPLASLQTLLGAGRTIAGFLVENPPPNLTRLGLWLEPPFTDVDLSLLERLQDALPRLNDLSVHERQRPRFAARRWGPAVARLVAPRLFRLRLALDALTPAKAREFVTRDAPHLTLQLEPETPFLARVWAEVDADGVRVVLREQVEATVVEPLARELRAAGFTSVDVLDLATGQSSRWEL
ncbi:MAG: zinc-ribbon domain-containing protein [Myxococcaceae bacterium]|nr:zinc-ribbon domain-containing protein [Myxococcaceae bacterium]